MSNHINSRLSKRISLLYSLANARAFSYCALIFVTTFLSAQIHASEQTIAANTKRIVASCDSLKSNDKAVDTTPCIFYVQGFLEGAWGVKNVKAARLDIKEKDTTSWEERAFRYRVGNRTDRNMSEPVTYYCSPQEDSSSRIIEQFAKDVPSNTIQMLNTQIYDAIKAVCPSDKTDEVQ